jgi:hypothetical protein
MGRVGKASTDYKERLSSSSTTTPYPSRTCVPKKGPPKLSRSSGHGTASYASPLANSPYQFRNKCTARKLFSSTKEPIQISRKGIYIKLYVKRSPKKVLYNIRDMSVTLLLLIVLSQITNISPKPPLKEHQRTDRIGVRTE